MPETYLHVFLLCFLQIIITYESFPTVDIVK